MTVVIHIRMLMIVIIVAASSTSRISDSSSSDDYSLSQVTQKKNIRLGSKVSKIFGGIVYVGEIVELPKRGESIMLFHMMMVIVKQWQKVKY